MTIREDIEPALILERNRFEAPEYSAKTIESTTSEHVPRSLQENIKRVAKELREAAKPHRTRCKEIRIALEEKHSRARHGVGGQK